MKHRMILSAALCGAIVSLGGCAKTCDSLASDYRNAVADGLKVAASGIRAGNDPEATEGRMDEFRGKLEKIRTAMDEKKCPPVEGQ